MHKLWILSNVLSADNESRVHTSKNLILTLYYIFIGSISNRKVYYSRYA